ncbi:MAG: DUF2358 domain-containing protein [Desertifilum sp. SIO1I2]|nr:DUF2358 domain-containing protein [Desertifilum sp. SIO1I2]
MENTLSTPLGESEYQTQIDRVIQTLRQDLPTLFERDITYDIYTSDIYFQDPVNKFKWKFNYRIIFWTLRFHARLFFTEIYFDVHDIQHPSPDLVLVHWTVRGMLRVPWKAKVLFNGSSHYSLNSSGLIYCHIDTWDRKPGEIVRQFFQPDAGE